MKRLIVISLLLLWTIPVVQAQLLPTFGGERAGTSGFQFLKIPFDARGAALGETVVADANDVSALIWNPALVSHLDGFQAGFHHTSYFVDVSLDFAGVTWALPQGISLGATLQTMNSGKMDVTTEFEPAGTGQTFRLIDVAAGLTLSQRLTDLFSYGVTTKYIQESVAGLTAKSVVFDLGIHYSVGSTGARMAVAVRNFGLDGRPEGTIERPVIADDPIKIESDFVAMTAPTTFHLGFAYDVFKQSKANRLTLLAQLNNPNDNAEYWTTGAEFGWNETFFLRAGYHFGIEEVDAPSMGAGFRVPVAGRDLQIDYGFNRMERLGNVHRFGLNFSL
ncbi:MAG: PorV/PorQ family protein [Rhodothermales bacterium]|nr:PorV/PorQ family protein [Rhodothermales bacterium]